MKRYAFIQNGIVTGIIEGKVDGSRNWEDYYGDKRGMLCVAIPENEPVGVGFKYTNSVFENPVTELSEAERVEQWRSNASLTRRKFMLGIKFYQYGTGTLEDAINTLRENLTEPTKTVIGISLDESTHFDRDDTDLKAMVSAIGMTPEQVDAFYVWAENEEWRNV